MLQPFTVLQKILGHLAVIAFIQEPLDLIHIEVTNALGILVYLLFVGDHIRLQAFPLLPQVVTKFNVPL